ncbi:hypothetical protein LF599_13735 [Pseudodesulfovibrio thermohalotolerans]|uniref:hypothetical protein n=1 Tax=Pseudodesulfovibrio thermohalotolerans TaxID=2880651 RepID=UPI0022B9E3B3|nr:hypothetical protein [Pseudodesulfovibrio thermohalotolerans]WFS61727.1 hypothetical protein LF599_13735 [Pseudodesulfovibrio thermohalotolerans]
MDIFNKWETQIVSFIHVSGQQKDEGSPSNTYIYKQENIQQPTSIVFEADRI